MTAAPYFLGIDLAERFSAAVLLDADHVVLLESVCDFGQASKPPDPAPHLALAEEWAYHLADALHDIVPARVGVEDVNPFAVNPKPALRVQGVVVNVLANHRELPVELISASAWQRHFGYRKVKGRTSKGWARDVARELGYVDGSAGKANTDLRDAYLLARYLRDLHAATRR